MTSGFAAASGNAAAAALLLLGVVALSLASGMGFAALDGATVSRPAVGAHPEYIAAARAGAA